MPSQSVLVIGGGLAGMSSAVALADAGLEVRLLEKRPHLGGRAASYTLPDGSEVDNCQHLTLGCCTNLPDFYRRVGAGEKIRTYDRLYLLDTQGRRATIRRGFLPPPFHLAGSLMSFRALTFSDKRGIGRALMAIARNGGELPEADRTSMLDWLRRMGQTPGAIERFWKPVLVSALDEQLERTSARYGIEVFWKAFLANREGYCVGLPSVPLGDLYEGCRVAIEKRGGEVRLRAGVRSIRICENRFVAAATEDGAEMKADACVVAVPHDAVPALFPEEAASFAGIVEAAGRLKTSPITSVHLWFDRKVMPGPYLALLDRTSQWIFNKTYLYGQTATNGADAHPNRSAEARPEPTGQYLQIVISASYDLVSKSRKEILDLCTAEIREVLPGAREAKILKSTIIKEVNATFSPGPGVDCWRPSQRTGVKNLFLAGDWTHTGWPATMEGAVRSGYLAAEALLAEWGHAQKFVQPDLRPEGLCRLWAHSEQRAEA